MINTLIGIDGAQSTTKPRRTFKTMLLFPPEWVPTAPYLALPSLTAVLRAYGHEVIQKDINIEMYDLFFTDTFLILKHFQKIDKKYIYFKCFNESMIANRPAMFTRTMFWKYSGKFGK